MGKITEYLYQYLGLRPLCCWCIAFSAAVFAAIYLLNGVSMLLLGGLLLFMGLVLCLRAHKITGKIIVAAALGFWMVWMWHYRVTSLVTRWPGRVEPVIVTALDYSAPTQRGVWVETKVEAPEALQGERLLLWTAQPELTVTPGDRLEAVVTLHSARETRPEWRYWNYSNGFFLTAAAQSATVTPQTTPFHLLPRVTAHRIAGSLEAHFPSEKAGFLLALCIGNTARLTGELENALHVTGLRHIAAASGLHVTVLTAAVLMLPGSRKRKSLLLLPLLLFYAAVVGFTPSITRAVAMQSLLLLAPLLGREADGPTSLSLALALILIHNPFAAASLSLQLSFSAMLGILLFTPPLLEGQTKWEKPGEMLLRLGRNVLAITFGANFLTLPISLHAFGSATTLSPLSNLVVLWLIPLLLPLAMLTAVSGIFLPPLAAALSVPTLYLTRMVIALIRGISNLPHLTLRDNTLMELWALLVFTVVWLIWRGLLRGRGRSVSAAALALGLLLCCLPEKGSSLYLLDVGQGQCILAVSGDTTAVIDCGSAENRGAGVLTDALIRQGCGEIDYLMLTHYDGDHINGVLPLLSAVRVGELLLPFPEMEDTETARTIATAGKANGATVTFLCTETETRCGDDLRLTMTRVGKESNGGLAALVHLGQVQILVTGDADFQGEEELLQRWPLEQVDILVAGHHGSASSTGNELLERTRPSAVLISVGENSYGHPTEEMLERFTSFGTSVWRTDRRGSICVTVEGTGRIRGNMLIYPISE